MQNQLTTTEISILCFIAKGLKNKEIAKELKISPSTVKSHIENIFRKLEVRNRLQVAIYAAQNNLV